MNHIAPTPPAPRLPELHCAYCGTGWGRFGWCDGCGRYHPRWLTTAQLAAAAAGEWCECLELPGSDGHCVGACDPDPPGSGDRTC